MTMTDSCLHLNQLIDEHEGLIVCPDCAHVVENYLFQEEKKVETTINSPLEKDALEILQRLNLPEEILFHAKSINNLANLYNTINLQSVVTMKEFCAASGLTEKNMVKANKETISQTSMDALVEKYCNIFNLNFKDCTLIKESISTKPYSGHPPLTILAYELYTFQRSKKIPKITTKKICKILGISPVSVQRYKKYVLSLRS